jgi:hypothetical protein
LTAGVSAAKTLTDYGVRVSDRAKISTTNGSRQRLSKSNTVAAETSPVGAGYLLTSSASSSRRRMLKLSLRLRESLASGRPMSCTANRPTVAKTSLDINSTKPTTATDWTFDHEADRCSIIQTEKKMTKAANQKERG